MLHAAGILIYSGGIYGVNVGKYSRHGAYGIWETGNITIESLEAPAILGE